MGKRIFTFTHAVTFILKSLSSHFLGLIFPYSNIDQKFQDRIITLCIDCINCHPLTSVSRENYDLDGGIQSLKPLQSDM